MTLIALCSNHYCNNINLILPLLQYIYKDDLWLHVLIFLTTSIITHCSSQYLWMIPITMCIDTYIMTTLVEIFLYTCG